MSYLNQAQGSQFKSYLGEDPSYTINAGAPVLSNIQKAQAMPRAVAAMERRRKMMTPQQRRRQDIQLQAFLRTLPAAKQKFLREVATRYASAGSALNGYSGQIGNTEGLGFDYGSAINAVVGIYVGVSTIQAQKDAQDAADKRAAQQAAAELEYQRAQTRMAEEAARAANEQRIIQAQREANKPKMSTGTKVAIGAGVAVAATVAVVALN